MSLQIEQINKLITKEFTWFASLLFLIIAEQVIGRNDVFCEEESFEWGPDSTLITWPETIASGRQIASDCLDDNKQLVTRTCIQQTGSWDPDYASTQSICLDYQQSYKEYGNCPPNYVASKTGDICYQHIKTDKWKDLCVTTGASSLSFLNLNSDEQYSILQEVCDSRTGCKIGLPAINDIPSKQISSEIDYSKEEVELQWLLPGRYGSILKLPKNSASVTCSFQNLCIYMCLSVNTSHSTADKPFSLTVDEYDNTNSVLCVSKKNSLLLNIGSDNYRVKYSTNKRLSYSIKMFDFPETFGDQITEDHCQGGGVFYMDTLESLIIYRQLASVVELKTKERCVFGISPTNSIITYSDWSHLPDYSSIKFTNWDKSVDFSTVQSEFLLTVNSVGEWRWEERATCMVCVMEDTPFSSELILKFSTIDSTLTLTVLGPQNLWREDDTQMGFLCFAVVADNYTEVTVEASSQSNTFSLANVGGGSYHCSGHHFQTLNLVRSNSAAAFGMVFAFYVEYHCDGPCVEPLDVTGQFEHFLSLLIDEGEKTKIIDLRFIEHYPDDSDQKARLMFHVMVSAIKSSLDKESNDIGLAEHELYTYYVLNELRRLPSNRDSFPFDILSIASREFCLPDTLTTSKIFNWKAAKAGETANLSSEDFILTRNCSINGTNGAVWSHHEVQFKCSRQKQLTRSLMELYDNFQSSQQTPEVIANLSAALHDVALKETDVFIISEILEKATDFLISDQIGLPFCDLKNVFDIFDSLMSISHDVAATTASQLNSTNSLLASLDKILINQVQTASTHQESDEFLGIKAKLVASYVLDPTVSGFSGIALIDKNIATDNTDFLGYAVKFLQPNQLVEAVLMNENITLASFVPRKLIDTWNNPKIIFTLFYNDVLFQTNKQELTSDGSIISLTILNSDSKFSTSIPFFFKANTALYSLTSYSAAQLCGYWSLSGSAWESAGCLLNELSLQISDTVLCECSHLTHFGNLVNTEILYSEKDEKVLNLITLTGCSLSLVGIAGIFLTAIIFRSWRTKSSSKFLLQLSATIAIQMILMIFINSNDDLLVTISENLYGCIAIGAMIHYSILVMFFWMLIVAYLQFIRYVIVFNQIATANFLLKSSIFGWGMPMLPVFIVVAVDPTSYIPHSNVKFCYPSGYGLWFGLFLPIILIIVANVFVFLAVIVSLIKGSSKSAACKVNDKNEAMWSQLRLSVFLFFALGLSWIFAFLSDRSLFFSYLFCLTATLQGLVLFLYFVILDPAARSLWKRLLTKVCCYKTY